MLDLIEITNGGVLLLMGLAFFMGFMTCLVVLWAPTKTKLDTLRRNNEIREFLS